MWYAKMSKYKFWLREVSFLGHVSFINGIAVNPSKVGTMFAIGGSQYGYENKRFLGLARHYRRFIKGFSHVSVSYDTTDTERTSVCVG